MISEKHKCIFVHIPKTAGQSVEMAFLASEGLTWQTREPLLLRLNRNPALGPERLAHLKAREYVDCGYVDRAKFDASFKFAFVRNPWDRLVSEYHYRNLAPQVGFREFVLERLGRNDDYHDEARHIIPQTGYVTDASGKIIVDYIGRFETLRSDFAHVARMVGLTAAVLPHRNPSKRDERSYRDYYDDELRRSVGDYYAEDVERFGYDFDGSFPAGAIDLT